MKNLFSVVQKKKLKAITRHGVLTLYAWIRFLECMLHISFEILVMKLQARTKDEKNIVKLRKIEVRAEF